MKKTLLLFKENLSYSIEILTSASYKPYKII